MNTADTEIKNERAIPLMHSLIEFRKAVEEKLPPIPQELDLDWWLRFKEVLPEIIESLTIDPAMKHSLLETCKHSNEEGNRDGREL